MNIPQLIIVFGVSWWLVFLPALSVGVRNHHEAESEPVAGAEDGAPVNPMLGKKAIWASLGAALITLAAWIIIPMLAP